VVEQWFCKPQVGGSSPSVGTIQHQTIGTNMRSLLIGLSLLVSIMFAILFVPKKHDAKLASATLYISVEKGHGSGVHIGNGLVLSAWHVVDEQENITAKDTNGVTHNAEVMWSNKTYDVALLRISDFKNVSQRSLSCRYLDKGEQLSFEGNPFSFEILTSWGRVSKSEIREIGDWKEAYVIDGTLGPGMSGGPAYDIRGYVVGINVGVLWPSNFVTIVPGRTICALLAR
jgi:S1-C subfamily serine protease